MDALRLRDMGDSAGEFRRPLDLNLCLEIGRQLHRTQTFANAALVSGRRRIHKLTWTAISDLRELIIRLAPTGAIDGLERRFTEMLQHWDWHRSSKDYAELHFRRLEPGE